MSIDPLTFERLRAAVEGTAAAFRAVTDLDPAGGDGDKLFPPTYQGGVYAREVRIIGGQPAPCVLLDSVQSQANRLELALLEWHRSVRAEQEKPFPLVQIETNEAGDAESPDPVYGHALARTWAWLDGHAAGEPRSVDFGVDALESILPQGQDLSRLCQDVRSAYPLLPSHLDLLAQTSPPPEPDPEISAFLHGTTRTSPDVTVVWRADLPAAQPGIWGDRVAVQPPATGEGCPVPIWEFRRWLANGSAWSSSDDSGDVEGIGNGAEAERVGKRIVLRWRGFDEADLVSSGEVMPGDTVVIPATYGGCDDFGWNPASPEPVADIGDAAAHAAGRKPVLRLEALAQVL